jgi:hypothetical protein
MTEAAFVYEAPPGRVVFGAGSIASVADEARRLGMGNALVLSTPGRAGEAERAAGLLGERAGGVFAGARMHTPVDVTDAAMEIVREKGIDGTVAIGGGSTTGLGKAIALRTNLPQIVIPTTYAGSEMTDMLGETSGGEKQTVRDPKVRPETVIYDVDLTVGLPKSVSISSGLNAMAHAVEALYAKDGNPVLSLMAEEGIRAIGRALPKIAPTARIGMRVATRSTVPGSAGLRSARLRSPSITSSATCSAALSICRMRRPTLSCCRTRLPTTRRRRRRRSSGWRERSVSARRRRGSTTWHGPLARRPRSAISACRRRGSTGPPTWPSPTPTGTRGRSTGMRSVRFSTTRGTGDGRVKRLGTQKVDDIPTLPTRSGFAGAVLGLTV